MGMSIDEIIQGIQIIKAQAEWEYPLDWQIVLDGATDTMRKYQQLKADYENRLKADMVAMLTDIQLEIEDEAWKQGCASSNDREDEAYKIYYFIQQKIDKLKEVEE